MLPKMPSEYKGKPKYSSVFDKPDGTNNGGRLWTNSEVEWVMNAIEDGYSLPEIAESLWLILTLSVVHMTSLTMLISYQIKD